MQLNTVLQTMRPSFLLLTPICVLLGFSLAIASQDQIDYFTLILIFIGAISAHISVNTLNEYHDYRSGLDFKTERTPFSGGSGALVNDPTMAKIVQMLGISTLAITITIGIYLFVTSNTMLLLPLGVLGILIIVTYTQWLNRIPLLCLIAPGMGFGLLMVGGTYMVLTQDYTQTVFFLSLVPFFLVNNLLLLNQYPDITADASVGRKTLPIVFGIKISSIVYAIFTVLAYSLIIVLIVNNVIPRISVIALLPAFFSLFSFYGALKYGANIGEHPSYMEANVASATLSSLFLGISIIYG